MTESPVPMWINAIITALADGSERSAREIAIVTGVPQKSVVDTVRRNLTLAKSYRNTINGREVFYRLISEKEHRSRSRSGSWGDVT